MTDIGAPDRPLRFVGEELQLDVFSGTDPADTGAHRWWYRDDLSVNESDAVIRVNNNGTIVDVPVFEESNTVEDGIETTFGVVAPGLAEPAFVPLAVPEDAAFDFARVETPAGQELAMHDRLAPGSAIPDSVISHLEFEDDSDTSTAVDSVGPYDGSITGASYTTDAAVGDLALSFSSGDQVSIGSNYDGATGGETNFSVAAWVKINSSQTRNPVITKDGVRTNSDNDWGMGEGDGGIFARIVDGSDNADVIGGAGNIPTGEWTHIAFVVDDSEIRGYIDNSVVETVSRTVSDIRDSNNAFVGYDDSNSVTLDGLTDDVFVANDALTDSDINDLYQRGQ